MTPPSTSPARIFYGWVVVAAAFAVTLIGFGSAYAFSVFVASLQREFAASRGSVSLVFSLAGFLYFGLGVISGPLADRFGARRLAVAGMLLVGAGLAAVGMARSLAEVYLAYGLGVGLGVGFSYVPVVGVVQRWFVKRRGFASGIAVSGIGVGTLVVPPLAAWLIDLIGWRNTFITLGAIAAVVGTGMAALIETDPHRRGLAPDGAPIETSTPAPPLAGATLQQAIRSRAFAALYTAAIMSSFGVFVPFVHLVPYAVDRGVPQASAVLLLGMIGVGSTAGRFLLGGVADRIGRDTTLLVAYIGMALALLLWSVSTSLTSLAVFAFVYGVVYGGWVAVMPAVAMDRFGGRQISGVIGALYTSVAFGTLIGPTAAGYAFDVTGSYAVPILLAVAGNVAAALITGMTASSSISRWNS